MLPVQDFKFVSLPIAKDKQALGEWIQFETLLNQGGQTVYRLAKVRVAAGYVDTSYVGFV